MFMILQMEVKNYNFQQPDQIRQDALQPLQFPPGSFHPIFSFFLSETWMMKGITRK